MLECQRAPTRSTEHQNQWGRCQDRLVIMHDTSGKNLSGCQCPTGHENCKALHRAPPQGNAIYLVGGAPGPV